MTKNRRPRESIGTNNRTECDVMNTENLFIWRDIAALYVVYSYSGSDANVPFTPGVYLHVNQVIIRSDGRHRKLSARILRHGV